MSEISTYTGPYARLRDIMSAERERQYSRDAGAYSRGYLDALDVIENAIVDLEREIEEESS